MTEAELAKAQASMRLAAPPAAPRRDAIVAVWALLAAVVVLTKIEAPPLDTKVGVPAHRAAPPPRTDGAAPMAPPTMALRPNLTPEAARLINIKLPFSGLPNPPAQPFLLEAAQEDRARAVQCLTAAIYYEAGNESDAGQAAVAQVVLNRLRHPQFPKTVCGVVFEGSELSSGCQFTFTCDGSLRRPPSAAGWARAGAAANHALDGHVMPAVGEATYYHADYVVPYWSGSLTKLVQIGAHIFYRWPGSLGRPGAFIGAYAGHEPAGRLAASLAQDNSAQEAPDDDAVVSPPQLVTVSTAASAVREQPALVLAQAAPVPVAAIPAEGYFGAPRAVTPRRHADAGGW